jgi:hypothetical protein
VVGVSVNVVNTVLVSVNVVTVVTVDEATSMAVTRE